jgi:transposase InsO family protein
MKLHPNAKTTPKSRALIVQRVEQEGWTVEKTAEAFGVSPRTVYKWRRRWQAAGLPGLADRSTRPQCSPGRTSRPQEERICRLRRDQRLPAIQIARKLRIARSTVGAVLRRAGLAQLEPAAPRAPVVRYERQRPGELVHVDIKSLGRIEGVGHRIHGDRRHRVKGIGWEHAHVCVDDASRVAYVELLPTLRAPDACGFVRRALQWFARHGVTVERVMTDNGSAYVSQPFRALCQELGVRHIRTRPYRPRTNGKAERFIQTLLREWAYGRPYTHSRWRARSLTPWVERYNSERPHTSLGYKTPMTRLQEVRP